MKKLILVLLVICNVCNAQQWDSLRSGTNGSAINAINTYGNKLCIGGAFNTAGGIATQAMAMWNDTVWSGVGTENNVNGFFDCDVLSLKMYHGELYAGGCFYIAPNGVSTLGLAKWNGLYWDSVGTQWINGGVYAMHVWNDTLYIGGTFDSIGNMRVNHIAKYYAPPDTTLGTNEQQTSKIKFSVYPNPTNTILNIKVETTRTENYYVQLLDASGRSLQKIILSNNTSVIDVSGFAKGIYQLQVCNKKGDVCHAEKFILR